MVVNLQNDHIKVKYDASDTEKSPGDIDSFINLFVIFYNDVGTISSVNSCRLTFSINDLFANSA